MKNRVWFEPTQLPPVYYYRFYDKLKHFNNKDFHAEKIDYNKIQGTFFEENIVTKSKEDEFFDNKGAVIFENYDTFVTQRLLTDAGLAFLDFLKDDGNKTLIAEIDDNIYGLQPYMNAHDNYKSGGYHQEVFLEQAEMSDGLIVSTDYLKKVYSPLNNNICVVQNALDKKDWSKALKTNTILKSKSKQFTILWCGSTSHKGDLDAVLPHLLKLKNKWGDAVRIILAGGVTPPNGLSISNGIEYRPFGHGLPDYRKAISMFGADLGIVPLLDNEFNRGKSNLRFLEYSALGIPTVCSDVEPLKLDIKNGICTPAYLEGDYNWFQVLDLCVNMSKEELHRIGLNANKYIYKQYNLKQQARIMEDFLETTHARRLENNVDNRGYSRTCKENIKR